MQFCREVNILHQQQQPLIDAVHKVNDPLVNYQLDLFFQCSLSSQTPHAIGLIEAKDLHQCEWAQDSYSKLLITGT